MMEPVESAKISLRQHTSILSSTLWTAPNDTTAFGRRKEPIQGNGHAWWTSEVGKQSSMTWQWLEGAAELLGALGMAILSERLLMTLYKQVNVSFDSFTSITQMMINMSASVLHLSCGQGCQLTRQPLQPRSTAVSPLECDGCQQVCPRIPLKQAKPLLSVHISMDSNAVNEWGRVEGCQHLVSFCFLASCALSLRQEEHPNHEMIQPSFGYRGGFQTLKQALYEW